MLTLSLFMFCNFAQAINTLLTAYEFAILAHGFYRCTDFHRLVAVDDATTRFVRCDFKGYLVAKHDFDVMDAHLSC